MELGFSRDFIHTQGGLLPAFIPSGKKPHDGAEETAQGHANKKSYQSRSSHRRNVRLLSAGGKKEVKLRCLSVRPPERT
jgi:hypothetical protein